MAGLRELWLSSASAGAFVRPGRPNRFPDAGVIPLRRDPDGFNYGITRPEIGVNAGLLPTSGPGAVTRTTYTGGSQVTGSQDAANPLIIQNVNVGIVIEVMSGYVRFYNCEFTADVSSRPNALITCLRVGILGVTVDRCKIRPTVPSYSTDAVRGHHVSVRRTEISNVIDGLGSFNLYGARTDNEFIGNVVHDLCKFDYDGGAHVDGSHNDCVQHQGGIGLIVLGNVFYGYNVYEDGTRPSDIGALMTTQCVLVQDNVAVSGVYNLGEVRIDWNWVVEGFNQVFAFVVKQSSTNTFEPSCKNNRWETGTTRYFDIRAYPKANVNGYSSQAMGTAVTYPADGNYYANTTAVASAKRGQPVPIRRDTSF